MRADSRTRPLYSADWRAYQHGGAYDQAKTMPLLYCLMLAKWAQRYERFIGNWPGQGASSAAASVSKPACGGVSGGTSGGVGCWHRALDDRDPVLLAESRFFEQAMKNFQPGDRIRLIGDEDGWYEFLAESGGGLRVTTQQSGNVVLVGFDAMENLAENGDPPLTGTLDGGKLLVVARFDPGSKPQVEAMLTKLAEAWALRGCQVVSLGQDKLGIAVCAEAAGDASE